MQELLHEGSRKGGVAHLARKCSEWITCQHEFDTFLARDIIQDLWCGPDRPGQATGPTDYEADPACEFGIAVLSAGIRPPCFNLQICGVDSMQKVRQIQIHMQVLIHIAAGFP